MFLHFFYFCRTKHFTCRNSGGEREKWREIFVWGLSTFPICHPLHEIRILFHCQRINNFIMSRGVVDRICCMVLCMLKSSKPTIQFKSKIMNRFSLHCDMCVYEISATRIRMSFESRHCLLLRPWNRVVVVVVADFVVVVICASQLLIRRAYKTLPRIMRQTTGGDHIKKTTWRQQRVKLRVGECNRRERYISIILSRTYTLRNVEHMHSV